MKLGIANKRVLITGGSKGIGASIAKQFLEEGAYISLISRNNDNLQKIFKSCGIEKDSNHDFYAVDLREKDASANITRTILAKHKFVDIVVHNVGGALGVKDPLAKVDQWIEVLNFNLGIPIEINNILIPKMLKKNWGRIVHISSISGSIGEPDLSFGGAIPYAVSKAALNSYIKGLAKVYAEKNIIISGVMPGAIKSKGKFWDKSSKSNPRMVNKFLKENYPIKRFGSAEEIAPFVALLASEHASFASGSIIPISGGRV